MRIGLVTGEYAPMPGGVGDYTRELARALVQAGHDVQVITRVAAADQGDGVRVHAVIKRWGWRSLWQIRVLAARERLDVLNLQYQAAMYDLAAPIHALPWVAGRPCVNTFHDLRIPYLFPKAGRLRDRALTFLAQGCRAVIATDARDAEALRARGLQAVTHIPIGSNIRVAPPVNYDRAAWRARLRVRPAEFLIGYFGFLNASKGGEALVLTLAKLVTRRAPVKLVLIGGAAGASDPTDREYAAKIERLIERHSIEKYVVRTGFIAPDEVSGWLLACDAMLLPYTDGVSLRRGSLLAALAHGVPVISTQPPEPLAEFSDGDNIRLVPVDAHPAMVLAVTGLMASPTLQARLSAGGRQLASAYGWGAIAERVADVLARSSAA